MNLRKLAPVTIISMLSLLPGVLGQGFNRGFTADNPAMEQLDVFGWGFATTIIFFSVVFAIVIGAQMAIHQKLKKAGLEPILGGRKTTMGISAAFVAILVAGAYIPLPPSILGIFGAFIVGIILVNVIILALVGMEFKTEREIVGNPEEAEALAVQSLEPGRFGVRETADKAAARKALQEEVKELHETAQILHKHPAIAELLEGKLSRDKEPFSIIKELKKFHQDILREKLGLKIGGELELAEKTLLAALTTEKEAAKEGEGGEFEDIEAGLKSQIRRLKKKIHHEGETSIQEAKKSVVRLEELRKVVDELIEEKKDKIDGLKDEGDVGKEDLHRQKDILEGLEEFERALTSLEKEIEFIEKNLEKVEGDETKNKGDKITKNEAKKDNIAAGTLGASERLFDRD